MRRSRFGMPLWFKSVAPVLPERFQHSKLAPHVTLVFCRPTKSVVHRQSGSLFQDLSKNPAQTRFSTIFSDFEYSCASIPGGAPSPCSKCGGRRKKVCRQDFRAKNWWDIRFRVRGLLDCNLDGTGMFISMMRMIFIFGFAKKYRKYRKNIEKCRKILKNI